MTTKCVRVLKWGERLLIPDGLSFNSASVILSNANLHLCDFYLLHNLSVTLSIYLYTHPSLPTQHPHPTHHPSVHLLLSAPSAGLSLWKLKGRSDPSLKYVRQDLKPLLKNKHYLSKE